MVAECESLLEQSVPRGRLAEGEEEGALGRDVAARAARRPARLAVPADHLAAGTLTSRTDNRYVGTHHSL